LGCSEEADQRKRSSTGEQRSDNREIFQGGRGHDPPLNAYARPTHVLAENPRRTSKVLLQTLQIGVSNGDRPVERGSIARGVDAKSKHNGVSCMLCTPHIPN
jgi:hypothetical protein